MMPNGSLARCNHSYKEASALCPDCKLDKAAWGPWWYKAGAKIRTGNGSYWFRKLNLGGDGDSHAALY